MSGSTDPPVSVKLRRLLNAYGNASENKGYCQNESTYDIAERAVREQAAARTALLTYLARHYVRRDATRPPASPPGSYLAARGILPWKPGDELPEERIRRLRDGADSAPSWRGWRATVGNGRVRHNRTDAVGRIVMDTDEGVDVAWDGTDGVVFYDRHEAVDKLEPEGER